MRSAKAATAVIPMNDLGIELRISLDGLINKDEERKRISKELEKAKADLDFVVTKLSKPSFIEKAPAALVEKEKARQGEFETQVRELQAALKRLG